MAADIHDGISQRLFSLAFHLAAAAGPLTDSPRFAGGQLIRARELADLTLDEARGGRLRPAPARAGRPGPD